MYGILETYASSLRNEALTHRRNLHRIPETAWSEYKTQAYLLQALQEMGFTLKTEHDLIDQESDADSEPDCCAADRETGLTCKSEYDLTGRESETDSEPDYNTVDSEESLTLTCGYDVTGHETGIVAELHLGRGPVTALRFDIDALSVTEAEDPSHFPFEKEFISRHPGCMHACGHDGHASIGLACAKIFSRFKEELCGTIRLIFQPAEEGCKGARAITDRHWLDEADYFLSGHIVGRDYDPSEQYDVIPGVSASLATTKMDVVFHGKACHASEPSLGINVLPAMASAILELQKISASAFSEEENPDSHSENTAAQNPGNLHLPQAAAAMNPENPSLTQTGSDENPVSDRSYSAFCQNHEKTLVNIGRIQAGEGRNIIPGIGKMEMETRGSTTELNLCMEKQALDILKKAAENSGCELEVDLLGRAPSVVSSPELCHLVKELCRSRLSDIRCAEEPAVFKASEDVAVMMEKVKEHDGKAIYLLFPTDTTAPLHNNRYDFSEDILIKGALILSAAVFSLNRYSDRPETNAAKHVL
ncbi:MAG: amidohydrolase [Eubacterium sp.]|nr:amidohydrolase [Eubacterium sp.]